MAEIDPEFQAHLDAVKRDADRAFQAVHANRYPVREAIYLILTDFGGLAWEGKKDIDHVWMVLDQAFKFMLGGGYHPKHAMFDLTTRDRPFATYQENRTVNEWIDFLFNQPEFANIGNRNFLTDYAIYMYYLGWVAWKDKWGDMETWAAALQPKAPGVSDITLGEMLLAVGAFALGSVALALAPLEAIGAAAVKGIKELIDEWTDVDKIVEKFIDTAGDVVEDTANDALEPIRSEIIQWFEKQDEKTWVNLSAVTTAVADATYALTDKLTDKIGDMTTELLTGIHEKLTAADKALEEPESKERAALIEINRETGLAVADGFLNTFFEVV